MWDAPRPRWPLAFLFVVASVALPALAQTPPQLQLPPPHALGGHCQLLVPCAESGPFAAHVRGLLELREADGQRTLQWGGHLDLSFSFFDWGEGGVSLYGLYGTAGLAQGPVTLWGRLSPPFLRWTGIDDTVALRLAAQVEYAAAFPPFDGQGTLFPSTHTYLAVADATAWRIRASLSAGAQLGDGAGPGYRGLQFGAGLWLRLDGAGVQAGAEVVGRAGVQGGTWRSEWTAALSVRMFDEGHQVKGGFSLPSSGGGSILVGYGFSCGPSYAAATCFRGLGRSLFERTQDRLGAAILASWRARQAAEALAERYAAAPRPPAGSPSKFRMDWLPARALDPPPQADCPPYDMQLRIYPCRVKVAGWRSAADLVKGAITGTMESLPGANLAPRVPPGSRSFEVGRGAAAVATGVVETIGGAAGAAAGGGVSGTGAGALVGVPVAAGAVAVGASGIKAVGDGVKRLVTLHRDGSEDSSATATKEKSASKARQGGTYFLKDKDTGKVMRNGRTVDLDQRKIQHEKHPDTQKLRFETDVKTNDYKEQRGIEQLRHEQLKPPMNKINGISRKNPRRQEYLDAGAKKLQTVEGK